MRYVGDPVAFVVAETLEQAKDAAELIEVDYETLPAVATTEEAIVPGAVAVWEDCPTTRPSSTPPATPPRPPGHSPRRRTSCATAW